MADYAKLIRKTGDINELAKREREKVSKALGETTQEAASIAYQLCAVSDNNEPGHVHTRDTIAVRQSAPLRFELVAGGAALFLEEGTIYMEAQPFIRPAVQLARRDFLERFRQS